MSPRKLLVGLGRYFSRVDFPSVLLWTWMEGRLAQRITMKNIDDLDILWWYYSRL